MIYLIIAVLLAFVDIFIKCRVENQKSGFQKEYLRGFIKIGRSHNKGGFLNIMQNKSGLLRIISCTMAAGVLFTFIISLLISKDKTLKTGLSMLAGGAVSNGYDRVKKGEVTDYVTFNIPLIRNINFNIGDFSIFAGVIALLRLANVE